MNVIYLDNAASAPLDPRLEPFLAEAQRLVGNPSAMHAAGHFLRVEIDRARARAAQFVGAEPAEIVFTSGASESNNAAVFGLFAAAVKKFPSRRLRILVSPLEHPSVGEAVKALADRYGAAVDVLPADKEGVVSAADVSRLITEDTVLVCVMWVSNILGSVQPVAAIGQAVAEVRAARPLGTLPLYFVCDAVQAAAWQPIDVRTVGVDALSWSGHKIGGPRGVGALYLRRGLPFEPLLLGGGQEDGRRAGTENYAGIVGLAGACDFARKEGSSEAARLRRLRQYFVGALADMDGYTILGPAAEHAAPHIVYVQSRRWTGDVLALKLDAAGIAVSAGSACEAGSRKAPVMLKVVYGEQVAVRGGIRVSFGRDTTDDDWRRLLVALTELK